MSFDLTQAQLCPSICHVTFDEGIPVRNIKKEEVVQLAQESLSLAVIVEKVIPQGKSHPIEKLYLVMGEYAQKELYHSLKMKTFIPAINQYGEKFIATINAPSPNGYTCGYYTTAQHAIPKLQATYGYLVNDVEHQCYHHVPVNLIPYKGDYPSLESALKTKFENAIISRGDEDVLVRLGKTFMVKNVGITQPTPSTLKTQPTPLTTATRVTEVSEDGFDLNFPELIDDETDHLTAFLDS